MSKREQRRKQSSGWQNAGSHMTLEEAGRLGYNLDIPEPEPDIPENAIVPAENGTFVYKRFQLKPTGLIIPDDLDNDEWLDIFAILRKLDEAIQWSVGDLVNHAETKWGETYASMAQVTGYNEKTLREYAYVARSVQLSIRMDNLSFGHHQVVAGLKDPLTKEPLQREQEKWLRKASNNNWSIKALRQAIHAEQHKAGTQEADVWLFGKDRIPNNKQLQNLWTKARHGDAKARQEVVKIVNDMRDWLDEIVDTLDEN